MDWFKIAEIGTVDNIKKYLEDISGDEQAVNVTNNRHETALLIACQHNNISIARYLIEELKADIELPDQWGNTPLMWACATSAIETAMYLIQKGANIEARNERKESPLIKGATNIKIVQALVKAGADVNHKDKYGYNAMHSAIFDNVVQYLVEHGADINEVSEDGFNILHLACESSNIDIVKYAVKVGANVNLQDNLDKETPLMHSINSSTLTRHYEDAFNIIHFLLLVGADINIKDKYNKTVIDIIKLRDSKKGKIRDLLVSWKSTEGEI